MAGKDDLLSSYKLLTSAHDGNLEEVKHIIENRKADINFADVTGKSVLHWACEGGKTDVVNYITRLPNVDLFKESDDLVTPLDISKQHDSALECMKKALVAHAERKVEEYELNMTVSNVRHVSHQSFLNETIARNYNCPYSKTDISTVLSFLCAPSISSQEAAVVEVEIDLPSMNSKISLYHTKQNETFFTFQARDDMVDRADDEITEALYKVMTIVQILKDKKKSTNVAGKVDLTKQIAEVKAIKLNKSDLQTQRMLLAAIINEMETSRKKIDKYSEFLDRVIRHHADSAAKPALCVIYFVELFACDDTFPEGKNIALAKGERRLLKQLKKDYYKRHYPREQLLNDITCLRTLFVHQNSTSRGLLKPSDMFESAENKEGSYDKEECLQYLQTFTRFVSDSMRNQNFSEAAKIYDKNEDSSFSIKTFSEYIRTRLEKGSKTSDMLSYFCKKSKEFLSSPNEMLHELLFELIVNTGPALRDNYMFSELRNTVVHDFHNETVSGLLRKLPLVTRKLYLHQLASRLAHVLSRMRDEEGNRKLEMELSNQLEELNKSFYELLQPNNSAHMFERGTSHNINAYVKYYLLFLADLLDEEKSNGDNIMELSSKRVITSDQVKLIFERILYLHDIFLRDQSESIPEESLRGDLITQFQISATEADRVVSRIKSEDKYIETDESLEFEKQVNDIIKTLNNLKHPFSVSSHKFSDDDIESLFNVAKLNWNYRELENLLKTYNLTELEKDTVTDVLLKVHMKLVDRKQQFSGEKISRVVSRLLRLIKNMELVDSNLHSLSEAFQNKQLLDYILIELLQPLEVPFKQFVLHKIIRDVSYVDCAAPIVAKVLSEPSSDILIERKALKKFVSIYLKTSDYNSLSNLFLIKSMFRTEALFEEVCEQHLSREQLTEVFKCIDVENVLYFFKCLTNTSESKVVLTVLAAANDYISDLLTLKKFESCQKIIDGASKVEQSLTQCDKSVGFHRCLLQAELLQEQGLSMERNKARATEVKPFYCKAKKELQRVEENATEHPLQKLLSISKLAYNEYLLCRLAPPRETRTKKKHAKKACRLAETLISNMQQYLSPLPAQSEQEEQSSAKIHTLFSLAENSPKYDSLLKAGKEYEDSLNVSEVYRRFLYYRFAVFDKKTSPEERLALLADYDKLQLLWEQRFSCSEIYLLKRKIPIIQGLDGEYNKLKTLELKIRCFEVAMESLGSFSATAEEAFKFMKESLKTIKEKT